MAMARQGLTSASRAWRNMRFSDCRRYLCSSKTNPGEVGEVAGIPEEHLHRKVLIFSPARTASQQGVGKTGRWKINFESIQKWENPLMGWTSTGDPYSMVGEAALTFDSKEAAVEFARKHGWEYQVKEPHQPVKKVKAYAENFKWKGSPAD